MKSCFFRPLFSLPFALGLSFAALPGLLQAQKGDRPGHVMKPPPAHWKIPEAPVVPAEKALATLAVAPGFVVNAYATEPMVEDPVAIAFDSDGRMWVAEMIGYMPDIDGKGEDAPVGRISVLEDRDGDGVAEHRTIFLDKLVLPRAVALADADSSLLWADHEQLFVTAIEESAGGPRPGKTEVIDPHYVKGGNPEHQANGMLFNLDNWYYNAKHDLRYRKVDGKWVSSPSEVRGQWGITQDDWGGICTNSNSNLISAETYQPGISLANPRHKFTTPLTKSTKDQRLWPSRINPGVNRGYMAETLDENGFLKTPTATCGLMVYRGDQFPAEFRGNLIIPEPAGNLVKRLTMKRKADGTISLAQATPGHEFLTSTDERCRIVNSATGPDGAVYLVDLYRGILQHSAYVTSYLRQQILARGLDKPVGLGRIWRVVHTGKAALPGPKLRLADNATLIAHLSHANGFWRDTAQRLLVQRGDGSVAPHLRRLLDAESGVSATPVTRLHALRTLEGLGILTAQDCFAAATSPSSELQGVAVLLAANFAGQPDAGEAFSAIEASAASPQAKQSSALRLQLCAALGAFLVDDATRDKALTLLVSLVSTPEAMKDGRFRDLTMSGLTSLEGEAIFRSALHDKSPTHPLLGDLAASALRSGDASTVAHFLEEGKTIQDPTTLRMLARAATLTRHRGMAAVLLERLGENASVTKAITEGMLDGKKAAGGTKYKALVLGKNESVDKALGQLDAVIDKKKTGEFLALFSFGEQEVFLKTEADQAQYALGQTHYQRLCMPCHQPHGNGQQFLAPPLAGSEWLEQKPEKLIALVLEGLTGPITVSGKKYTIPEIQPIMPGFRINPEVTDESIAAILTYVRNAWDNGASPVSIEMVKKYRKEHPAPREPFTADEWWKK